MHCNIRAVRSSWTSHTWTVNHYNYMQGNDNALWWVCTMSMLLVFHSQAGEQKQETEETQREEEDAPLTHPRENQIWRGSERSSCSESSGFCPRWKPWWPARSRPPPPRPASPWAPRGPPPGSPGARRQPRSPRESSCRWSWSPGCARSLWI